METLISLDDFKQLMLFKVIDSKIPTDARFITVDGDGKISWFKVPPHKKGRQWMTRVIDSAEYAYSDSGGILTIEIPEHISWEECIIEI